MRHGVNNSKTIKEQEMKLGRLIWIYIKHWFARFESEYEHKPRFIPCQGCKCDLKLWKELRSERKGRV
jgi:hypothetical protein